MARVNNKWENEEAWNFHIRDKNKMREIILSDDEDKMKELAEIPLDEKLLTPDNPNEGDPPNMDFLRKMWAEYYKYAQQIGIPIFERVWLESGGKRILALYRQDSAYAERIGGVMQYIMYNGKAWKRCKTKKQRLEFINDAKAWWNENDARDRTRPWIEKMWNKMIDWYARKEFWEKSVNFIINYCVDHEKEWQAHVMFDPKVWYPRGRGTINIGVHGGMG